MVTATAPGGLEEGAEEGVAAAAEGGEGVEDVAEGDDGVLDAGGVERGGAAVAAAFHALKGGADAGNLLHHPHLDAQERRGAGVVAAAGDGLGHDGGARGVVRDHGPGARPGGRIFAEADAGHLRLDGHEQGALGGGADDVVDQGDQAVDMSLLVDDVFDKGMDLAVDQRIEFHDKRVLAVGPGGVFGIEEGAVGGKPAATPAHGHGAARDDAALALAPAFAVASRHGLVAPCSIHQ